MELSFIIKEIETIIQSLDKQASVFVKKREKSVLDLVRIDQLFVDGADGDGQKFREYTPFTQAYKRSQGKHPYIVTLNDEGDFYAGFSLTYSNSILDITSTDKKTVELTEKYGKEIFKLQVKHVLEVDNQLKNDLISWVLTRISL